MCCARSQPGSTLAMKFLLPLELADPEIRLGVDRAEQGARASGTPFLSFFTPPEMLTLARAAGFREVQHISAASCPSLLRGKDRWPSAAK